jgi:hypothetical protein
MGGEVSLDPRTEDFEDSIKIGLRALDELSESQWRALVARRLIDGNDRMDSMESSIHDNTQMTRATWDNTAEIREVVLMGRTMFATMGKIARGCGRVWAVLKPIVGAGAMLAAAYVAMRGAIYTFTHGVPPPK